MRESELGTNTFLPSQEVPADAFLYKPSESSISRPADGGTSTPNAMGAAATSDDGGAVSDSDDLYNDFHTQLQDPVKTRESTSVDIGDLDLPASDSDDEYMKVPPPPTDAVGLAKPQSM